MRPAHSASSSIRAGKVPSIRSWTDVVSSSSTQGGAHRDPYVAQVHGRPEVLDLLRARAAHICHRPVDSPDHVGQADLVRWARQPKPTRGPALTLHMPTR